MPSIPRRSIPQPAGEVVLPHGSVELKVRVAASDVVHEHVEAAVVSVDALDKVADLLAVASISSPVSSIVSGRRISDRPVRLLRPVA